MSIRYSARVCVCVCVYVWYLLCVTDGVAVAIIFALYLARTVTVSYIEAREALSAAHHRSQGQD